MAINRTGALFKGFTFDSEDSKDYGIYITGEAVFNAPERDVELISIPGRNGSLALDRGRFNNIVVSYPAGFYGDTEEDFADAASALRNMLASRPGYCRLEDDYNPDEYRLALYRSGLEISPADLKSGTTEITFECQPQRFLKSGETAIEVEDGDTLTNPTLFESRPMLQVWGHGGVNIAGQQITVFDTTIGNVPLYPLTISDIYFYGVVNEDPFETGDPLTIKDITFNTFFWANQGTTFSTIGAPTVTGASVDNWDANIYGVDRLLLKYGWDELTFYVGTTYTVTSSISVDVNASLSLILQLSAKYDADDHSITIQSNIKATSTILNVSTYTEVVQFSAISGHSTKTALGSPLYFDLDIGEAYVLEGGAPVSVNNAVSIPARLPTLKPGANEITFDNTITKLEIVPRWFIV